MSRPDAQAISRADWMAARASLAARRLRPLVSVVLVSSIAAVAALSFVGSAPTVRIFGAAPFVVALSGVLSVLALAFAIAVAAEARAPTIAHAREAERLTGLPVVALASKFRVPREGRARLQPGVGLDPFRQVYLSLTARGVRERIVCVTGDDAMQTVAVAASLAVAAATDERATLVVDLSPGAPSASAYFGWRDEPGFTDAIAGVRLWREVARPIGASEGLDIEVVPAGLTRRDTEETERSDSARHAFREFLDEYDFSVLVAPAPRAVLRAREVGHAQRAVVVARAAQTKHTTLAATIAAIRELKIDIHSIVLF